VFEAYIIDEISFLNVRGSLHISHTLVPDPVPVYGTKLDDLDHGCQSSVTRESTGGNLGRKGIVIYSP